MLFKKNLYAIAISLAKDCDEVQLCPSHRRAQHMECRGVSAGRGTCLTPPYDLCDPLLTSVTVCDPRATLETRAQDVKRDRRRMLLQQKTMTDLSVDVQNGHLSEIR